MSSWFQSLIGILQTWNPESTHRLWELFQSLIGILQTNFSLYFYLFIREVSIPHRYSTNSNARLESFTRRRVSIPHRYSTNMRMPDLMSKDWNCFNPSQVFYKLFKVWKSVAKLDGFNPSQVFYKLAMLQEFTPFITSFNPSQVFYKRNLMDEQQRSKAWFQSLIGILQTQIDLCCKNCW